MNFSSRRKNVSGGAIVSLMVASTLLGCGGSGRDASVTQTPLADAPILPNSSCESLLSVKIPNVTILTATSVAAGSYTPPGTTAAQTNLPDFCRVTATSNPVAGSSIGLEMWFPSKTWNGRYMQVGTHGLGGTIFYGEMAPQLRRGFATAATDAGHMAIAGAPFSPAWAIGNPQKVIDYGHRATHELADKAKTLIAAYYAQPQSSAYYDGCSFGGHDGMQEAQRYPSDFNGILAGGALANQSAAGTQNLVANIALQNAGIVGTSGAATMALAQKLTLAACDGLDGVIDGIISNPSRCHWNPASAICVAGQDPTTCLTAAQAAAIATVTTDATNPVTGAYVFGGLQPGAEHDMVRFGLGAAPFSVAFFQIAYGNASWDPATFNLSVDYPILVASYGSIVDALNPDLSGFKAAGGKLLQWHTWNDSATTPKFTVDYYDQVAKAQGGVETTQNFYRLFMMPGQGHCAGSGTGPSNIGAENQLAVSADAAHDAVTALMQWVEKGIAPQSLIASRYTNDDTTKPIDMQRPLCPYPLGAVYKGTGDTSQASSFYCGSPESAAAVRPVTASP